LIETSLPFLFLSSNSAFSPEHEASRWLSVRENPKFCQIKLQKALADKGSILNITSHGVMPF